MRCRVVMCWFWTWVTYRRRFPIWKAICTPCGSSARISFGADQFFKEILQPKIPNLEGNLYALRQQREDLFEELIGSEFEGLHNVYKRNISLKLKSPYMSYIVRDWAELMPVESRNFEAVASFALGGLDNAWGAGVFRFTGKDLEGFPINVADLEPFYDEISNHMGISGANDDLASYFGAEPHLLPPMRQIG